MMDTKQILATINADLVRTPASRVIYLEGITDPPIFFGLLGLPQPTGNVFLHNQTLVKGLSSKDGSGNKTVRTYVETAQQNGYAGRVVGIVDGDGEELSALTQRFDMPFQGPLFAWKAYSIESLLPRPPSWPSGPEWGTVPNWQVELLNYAPYVAVNRLRRVLVERLEVLRLTKFWNPETGQALETATAIEAALRRDSGLVAGFDVAAEFSNEVARFATALANSLDGGLALFNGKWLLRHFLVVRGGRDEHYWLQQWAQHGERDGGLPEVRQLWERITGSPP